MDDYGKVIELPENASGISDPKSGFNSTTALSSQRLEDHPNSVIFTLSNGRGRIPYRRGSFKRLLNNDSAKYHENGQKEVFEEFQKYSIRSQYLINNKLKNNNN